MEVAADECMPIKYNLTKFDLLATKVRKVSTKRNSADMLDSDDKITMLKAVIIAAFASGHSWQTFKALTSPPPRELNKSEIKKESYAASESKWKTITSFDIVEVSNLGMKDSVFSEWMLFNVDREQHNDYKTAWESLKQELDGNCDDVENDDN